MSPLFHFSPLSCTPTSPAILFALEQVNNQTEGRWKRELPNKTLGAIILDSCSSSLVLKNKLLQLHQGNNQSYWPLNSTQAEPPIASRILGYIGGFISDASFAMSNILVPLLHDKPYVQLSPTSTAPRLSDRQEHPFFMRLVESGDSLIAAIFDMLRKLSASYVQIIYDSQDTYSEPLRTSFQANATKHGVCLAQIINYQNHRVPSVLQTLRNFPGARIIIVILQFHKVQKLMGELQKITDADPKVGISPKDSFVFLGTDGWGRNMDVIKDTEKVTWGSLSISEEIALDPGFADYFKTVDPSNTPNFWLKDYWEEKKKCHLNLSFRRQGRSVCNANYRDDYTQDPTVSYYIQAVYAFASGVGEAIAKENCDISSNSICRYLTSKEIVDKMTNVSLDLFNTGESRRVFDSNGDGKNGYKFVQAHPVKGTMKYREIGKWTQSGGLDLSVPVSELANQLPSLFTQRDYNSACPNSHYCGLCLSSDGVPERVPQHPELARIPVITGFVVLCFLLLIFVVVVIVLIRRHRNYVKSTINKSSHCPIRFENEGMSEFSVETSYSSQRPIQEIHPQDYAGSFLEHSDLQPRTSDYATIVHPANREDPPSRTPPPPPPCRARSTSAASAYLTPAECLEPVSSQDDVFLNGGQGAGSPTTRTSGHANGEAQRTYL
ncbi:metabotropic glutamate receptor 7-like [Littorina saxatilis]|uniref:metabotropic glutamate receptor 7-like n=1 Tax=Littorina saxatilis TaxID=31220 RepID=UPI0038B4F6FC